MNLTVSPLQPGTQGRAVADLHDALLLLIERKVIKSSFGRRRPTAKELQTLTTKLEQERARLTFGDATRQLVRYFQSQHKSARGSRVSMSGISGPDTGWFRLDRSSRDLPCAAQMKWRNEL